MNELPNIVTEKKGTPITTSRKVAEVFDKNHKDVLETIREIIETLNETDNLTADFSAVNFIESTYNVRGKKYPEFILTKQAFTLITMGYSGKKAMKFKIRYIQQFEQMESFIHSLQAAKLEFPAFTSAIMQAHEEPKHYHFSNEINMINKIVLGVTAAKFKEEQGIDKNVPSIRPYLSGSQIKGVEALQRIDIGLIVSGMEYEARKKLLTEYYAKTLLQQTA